MDDLGPRPEGLAVRRRRRRITPSPPSLKWTARPVLLPWPLPRLVCLKQKKPYGNHARPADMGRRPSKPGSIARLRERKKASGRVIYYYDTGGKDRKEIPLDSDYGLAIMEYAKFERDRTATELVAKVITCRYVAEKYKVDIVPTKSTATQFDNKRELKNLIAFFDDPPAPLETIEPLHVRQYLTWRKSARVRANREKALLSAIWNYARDKGYTSLANPCAGIKGNKETGRDMYVEDALFKRVHDKADIGLRDAMDLAYLTGQRVTDTRMMDAVDRYSGRHTYDGCNVAGKI